MTPTTLHYPRQFDAKLRDLVELEITRGRQALDRVRKKEKVVGPYGGPTKEWEAGVKRYVLEGCLVFNKAACTLLERGAIPSELLTEFRYEFLVSLVREAQNDQGYSASGEKIKLRWHRQETGFSFIERDALANLQNSFEWSKMLSQQARALQRKLANEQPTKGNNVEAEKQRRKELRDKVIAKLNRSGVEKESKDIAKLAGVSIDQFNAWLYVKRLANKTKEKIEAFMTRTINDN